MVSTAHPRERRPSRTRHADRPTRAPLLRLLLRLVGWAVLAAAILLTMVFGPGGAGTIAALLGVLLALGGLLTWLDTRYLAVATARRKHGGLRWLSSLGMSLAALLLALAAVFVYWCWLDGSDTVVSIVRRPYTDITDYEVYPSRQLHAGPAPFQFKTTSNPTGFPQTVTVNGKTFLLDDLLSSSGTVAFLAVKDGTLLYESYFQGYSQSSLVQIFSVAKPVLSTLIGKAIDDGYIRSVSDAVTDYVPELASNGFGRVTIKHLLQMTSGSDYQEGGNGNPLSTGTLFTYTPRLEEAILRQIVIDAPGTRFNYSNGDNALLALILTRALRNASTTDATGATGIMNSMSISDYMQQVLWTPLGMESDGVYTVDHAPGGLEKTWCCLALTARDLAKFGRLYLNSGNWNGRQIVSRSWVEQSTQPSSAIVADMQAGQFGYGYQWWLMPGGRRAYMGVGHLGQYLYIDPKAGMVIVRLGRRGDDWNYWTSVFTSLAERTR